MQAARFRDACFTRAAHHYDAEALIQQQLARRCARVCDARATRVLELGCGTGILTRLLRQQLPAARIVATDPVKAMLARAIESNDSSRVQFELQDASGLVASSAEVQRHAPYELVTSSALLQWLPDLEAHLRFVSGLLAPRGRYVFSAFTRANLPELNNILAAPPFSYLKFPGVEPAKLQSLASATGFALCALQECEEQETSPSPLAVLRQLRSMGASRNPRDGGRLTRQTLDQLVVAYAERHSVPGGVSVTWRSCTAVLEHQPQARVLKH